MLGTSDTGSARETSASTSGSRPRWPTSRSVGRRTRFLGTSIRRAAMRSGSLRRARSSSPDGHDGGRLPASAASRLCGSLADAERDPAEEVALIDPSVSLRRSIKRIRRRDRYPNLRLRSRLRKRLELPGTVLAVVRDQSGVRPSTRLRLDAIRIGDATARANEVDASLEPLPPSKGEDRIEPVGSEFFQAADLLRAARIDYLGGAEPSDEARGLWDGCRPKHAGAPKRCELHGEGADSPRRPEDQDDLAPAQMQCIVDPLERR